MKQKQLIDSVRSQLANIIRNTLILQKGCIGMYYKNPGQSYTIQQTKEEYGSTPIVAVVHDPLLPSYQSIEAATVYDIYLINEKICCTLRQECGEDFEEPIENLAVESLLNIVNWLMEYHFYKPDNSLSDQELDSLLEDDTFCESFLEIIDREMHSDEEPDDKKCRQLICAYRNDNCEHMLFAICGWGLETLIEKAKSHKRDVFADEYKETLIADIVSIIQSYGSFSIKDVETETTPSISFSIVSLLSTLYIRMNF